MISKDVAPLMLGFFNDETVFPASNRINIVLVPNKKHPQVPSNYRPISLSNVVYKILSKTIMNRLKLIFV